MALSPTLRVIRRIDEMVLFPLRWKYLVRRLSPYLRDQREVLDLGASCGRLAHELILEDPRLHIVGVDTYVQDQTFIEIQKYDGMRIPFPDDTFDCVLIVDVIHHDTHPERIIREATRVSKRFILIKDHYWLTMIDRTWLGWADYIGNRPYQIDLPYHYLQTSEWERLFAHAGLTILATEKFRYHPIDPTKHIIYFLEKTDPDLPKSNRA